ncbi:MULTISPECIES: response regulator [Psychrilyobacter]|uniref:Response regulator n=1 Tax=Psychrilyobacter piezotolerans TaxID=2293438 RepID=A0ABX9KD30_9FUSO|nr:MULTISPECIES: response regulator transcription factor [Psychrilyobacter]MCS5422672.1 response regulator transcription factor [Psychrilyobacter sp. S5]NDI79200.1 response regulator transcription factor [Psychrilyobacter piezotolerans]RDE58881.1 DNA-binding response regulator [Psychrilyobacter sp. S5]REI39391.1 response regulator [Psychrilyobacter piezotolerans]
MKILLVEDEKQISDYITKGLLEAGYDVDAVDNGEDAISYATNNDYSLILLDIMIPKKNGIEVVKYLKKQKDNTHIILISAKDQIQDKVVGLDAGADDYLVKPFAFSELLARIRAIFRRSTEGNDNVLTAENLKMDLVKRIVSRDGQIIDLTSREFNLLEYFIENKNTVLTRMMITEKVWNINFISDTNVVDVYINHLRKKIDKAFDKKLIHTVRGVGYILKD